MTALRIDTAIDRFLAGLRAAGVPAVDGLLPGVDDAAIDDATRPFGISLPEEARRWWRRCNGVSDEVPGHLRTLGVAFEPLPIAFAADTYRSRIEMAQEMDEIEDDPPGYHWEPTWWPVFGSVYNSEIAVDTGIVRDGCSPVHHVDWQQEFRPVRAQSLAEVLDVWTEAVDHVVANGGASGGSLDLNLLPDRFWQTRLV